MSLIGIVLIALMIFGASAWAFDSSFEAVMRKFMSSAIFLLLNE